jgi:broad specificity phosphatase PhoE
VLPNDSHLMLQILLVRHGRPAVDFRTRIPGSAFGAWLRSYDEAPLDVASVPPADLRARVATVGCIASSPLRRSRESAAHLAAGRPVVCDALFAEAGVPSTIRLGLALRPRHWTLLLRVAWFCGWSGGAESVQGARRRAQSAAERLAELAREHRSVMLIGHGEINRMISRVLRRMGWDGPVSGSAYWSVAELQREAARESGGAWPSR